MNQHLIIGVNAEKKALQYLQRQRLKLICKNYKCYFGEIDLIMHDQSILVFVEVRYRSNPNFGSALESITRSKINRICKTAWHYLRANPNHQRSLIRFDVVAIESDSNIQWIKNAFEVQY